MYMYIIYIIRTFSIIYIKISTKKNYFIKFIAVVVSIPHRC